MEHPRLDLSNTTRIRHISHVDFHNENVNWEECNSVIMMLSRDMHTEPAALGLLAALYAYALNGKPYGEIRCSEKDLAALSSSKFAYPYVPEDGKLHVRLFMVGSSEEN